MHSYKQQELENRIRNKQTKKNAKKMLNEFNLNMDIPEFQLLQSCSQLPGLHQEQGLCWGIMFGPAQTENLLFPVYVFPLTWSAAAKQEPCAQVLFLRAQCNGILLIKFSWPLPHGRGG